MGNEVKRRTFVEYVYYHRFTVMLFVCELLYSILSICFVSFALCCALITRFMFLFFVLCLFSSFVCFAFYFVFCVFVLFRVLFLFMRIIMSPFYFYTALQTTDCHRVETELQLINIISYHTFLSDASS
jgi:hypothetical protein